MKYYAIFKIAFLNYPELVFIALTTPTLRYIQSKQKKEAIIFRQQF